MAVADPITFFDTGVDANGSPLGPGTSDPHYSLIYSSNGGPYTATATTANPAWTTSTDGAQWISPSATGDGTQNANSGYYIYEATLDLTGYAESTAVLSGMLAADDAVWIYLNQSGSAVFGSATGFTSLTPFLINSGFIAGVNEIDFVVANDSGPTGLLVDDVAASADAPEPASLILVATGALLAWGGMRRHRRLQHA